MRRRGLDLKDDRVEQCLRSCGSEFQTWDPKQGKVRKPRVLRLYCWIFSMRMSERCFVLIIMFIKVFLCIVLAYEHVYTLHVFF